MIADACNREIWMTCNGNGDVDGEADHSNAVMDCCCDKFPAHLQKNSEKTLKLRLFESDNNDVASWCDACMQANTHRGFDADPHSSNYGNATWECIGKRPLPANFILSYN
jgi:hypothetical protein